VSDVEVNALLAELEAHFRAQRFLNTAAAFDAVKDFVFSERAPRGA
jgi:hypothetical protein